MMYSVVLIEESMNSSWERDKNKVEKQNRRLKNMLDIPLSLIIINKSPMNSSQSRYSINPEQRKEQITMFESYEQEYREQDPAYSMNTLRDKYLHDEQEKFITDIHLRDKGNRQFIHELLGKIVYVLNEYQKEQQKNNNRLEEMCVLADEKDNYAEGLKEKIALLERNIHDMVILYEKEKIVNSELVDKITEQEADFKEQTKTIHKTFVEAQQNSRIEQEAFNQLYENNEYLTKLVHDLKKQKNLSEEENIKLISKDKENQEIIERLKMKITELDQRLVEKYEIKQEEHPYREITMEEHEEMMLRDSYLEDKMKKQTKLSEEMLQVSIGGESMEIANSFFRCHPRSLRGSQEDLSETFGVELHQEKKGQYDKLNLMIDPYYSHYLLTSQSVKIKEDCEEMLNIDMKPYYKQIIEKRIPMHLWDQWVKNRLRELLKLNFS